MPRSESFKYKDYRVTAFGAYYKGGRKAIVLTENGVTIAKATVNIPEVDCADDEVLIKDYAENKGVYMTLWGNMFIHPSTEKIPVGHAVAFRCKLTGKGMRLWE